MGDGTRRYEVERGNALLAKTGRIERLRYQRDNNWPGPNGQTGYCGKTLLPLVLAALPIRPVPYLQVVRRVEIPPRLQLVITMTQNLRALLPHGNDSHLVNYLVTYADEETGFVPLKTASHYLRFVGLANTEANREDLGLRLGRIAGLGMVVQSPMEASSNEGIPIMLVARWKLPGAIRPDKLSPHLGFDESAHLSDSIPYGIWINRQFTDRSYFRDPIPFPIELMRELRRDAIAYRLCLLLNWRAFALDRQIARDGQPAPALLPWATLASALGSQTINEYVPPVSRLPRDFKAQSASLGLTLTGGRARDFRRQVAEALAVCTSFWRELNATITDEGIALLLPNERRHLLPDATDWAKLTPAPRALTPAQGSLFPKND